MSALPGLTDTNEYHQIFGLVTDDSTEGAAMLRRAVALRAACEELIAREVHSVRSRNVLTWAEIGAALGVSVQAAHKRYHQPTGP